MSENESVIVIGGGAAGMLAAYAAGKQGAKVTLFEKNEKLGKKLYITGKGRCNITNACEIEDLLNQVVSNYQFLYSSIYGFTNEDIISLLEENGCKTKIERGNRVFPVSDHSQDVISALEKAMKKVGVKIKLNTEIASLLYKNEEQGKKKYQCIGVSLKDKTTRMAEHVIVTTGGLSYASTGSTGDGYEFARKIGHKVTKLQQSLVPFNTREEYVSQMQGLSLRNVIATFHHKDKVFYEEMGELLFTHFGISGPLVLSASAYMTNKMEAKDIRVTIDLKPALDEKKLDERILRDFEQMKNKEMKNALDKLLPSSMRKVVLSLTKISEDKKIHDVTKEERERLIKIVKAFQLSVDSLRSFNEAIITKGGIMVKEIDPSTMESKLCSGLYFAGEVLDLDALTGGYNLQIAWSTGYAAGMGATKKK